MILILILLMLGVWLFTLKKDEENPHVEPKKKSTNATDKAEFDFFPHREIRGIDTWGSGALGAPRKRGTKRYKHKGTDYVYRDNEPVLSPISGTVKRYGIAYSNSHHTLIVIQGTGVYNNYYAKVLYIDPAVSVGESVVKGELIGFCQSLQSKHPNITDHIHYELWLHAERKSEGGILLDPETLQEVTFNY